MTTVSAALSERFTEFMTAGLDDPASAVRRVACPRAGVSFRLRFHLHHQLPTGG